MVWRRTAALGVGATAGSALCLLQRDQDEGRYVKKAEACCPCSAMTLGMCAVGTGVAAKVLYHWGESILTSQGYDMLRQLAEAGDPAALFTVASAVLSAAGEDVAAPHFDRCHDTSPDCGAMYAMLLDDDQAERTGKILTEAAKILKAQVDSVSLSEGTVDFLAPQPPGSSHQLDEDDRAILQMVSQPHIRTGIAVAAGKAVVFDESKLSDEAYDSLLYICAVRGYAGFYSLLAQRELSRGHEARAANYLSSFLRPVDPEVHAHHKEHLTNVARHLDPTKSAVQEFYQRIVVWWALQYPASVVSLCRLRMKGISYDFSLSDEEASHALESATTSLHMLQPTLVKACPPEVSAMVPTVVEQCSTVGTTNSLEEVGLCSDGLQLLSDALLASARRAARQAPAGSA